MKFEVGTEPWVEIGRLEVRDGTVIQPERASLDLLLDECGGPLVLHGDFRVFPKLVAKAQGSLRERE